MGGEWRLIFGGAYFRNLAEKWWIQTTWHQGYFTGHSAESLASFSCACVQCTNYRRSFICENDMGCFVTYYSIELFAWVSHLCAVRVLYVKDTNGYCTTVVAAACLSTWNKSIHHAKIMWLSMIREPGSLSQNDGVTLFCLPFVTLLDVIPEVVQGDVLPQVKPGGLGWVVTDRKNTE